MKLPEIRPFVTPSKLRRSETESTGMITFQNRNYVRNQFTRCDLIVKACKRKLLQIRYDHLRYISIRAFQFGSFISDDRPKVNKSEK